MNKINLKLAGYNIEIVFFPCNNKQKKNYLLKNINNYFKNFIKLLEYQKHSIDFRINIKDDNLSTESITHLKNREQTFFFKKKNKTITTFYHISFNHFLKIISFVLDFLLLKDGLAIHSSSIVFKNKIIFFLGKSGSGKSTIVKLLKSCYQVFSDEAVIVRKVKSNFITFQSFIKNNKNSWVNRNINFYPLRAIFFLKKSKYFKIKKIESKNLLTSMILNQIWLDRSIIKYKLKLIIELIETLKNKFFFLYFNKNRRDALSFFSRLDELIEI